MNIDAYKDGLPCWIELNTPDPVAAGRFYGELFGWNSEPGPADNTTHLLRGLPVAQINADPAAQRAVWTTYINTLDADATAESTVLAGGSVITAPADRPDSTRTAVLEDHSGARFGIWQARERKGAGLRDEPGTFSWGELITDDIDASAAFYGTVFGWAVTDPEGPLGRREWQQDSHSFSGLLPRPPAMPSEIPPYWDVYFAVNDADATVDTVARLGGTTLMPATAIKQGTIAVFTDPAGAVFTVIANNH